MRTTTLLLALALTLVGCAHTGHFVRERRFHVETVDFYADGSFVFSCWFDDGAAAIEVEGTWRPGDKKDTAISIVPGLGENDRTACVHLRARETWEFRLNGWHRGVEGPYRRSRQRSTLSTTSG